MFPPPGALPKANAKATPTAKKSAPPVRPAPADHGMRQSQSRYVPSSRGGRLRHPQCRERRHQRLQCHLQRPRLQRVRTTCGVTYIAMHWQGRLRPDLSDARDLPMPRTAPPAPPSPSRAPKAPLRPDDKWRQLNRKVLAGALSDGAVQRPRSAPPAPMRPDDKRRKLNRSTLAPATRRGRS